MSGTKGLQVRIDGEILRAVDHLAVDWGLSRADALERLLAEAIAPYRDGNPWLRGQGDEEREIRE